MKIGDILIEKFQETSSTLAIAKDITNDYLNNIHKSYNYKSEKYNKFIIFFSLSDESSHTDINKNEIYIYVPEKYAYGDKKILRYFVTKTLMHELTHALQYDKISKNIDKFPDSNKEYYNRSHELDARYNDGFVDVSHYPNIGWKDFLSVIISNLTRNGRYNLDNKIIKKYTAKAYKDYMELKNK